MPKYYNADEITEKELQQWELKKSQRQIALDAVRDRLNTECESIEKEIEFCDYYIDLFKGQKEKNKDIV